MNQTEKLETVVCRLERASRREQLLLRWLLSLVSLLAMIQLLPGV